MKSTMRYEYIGMERYRTYPTLQKIVIEDVLKKQREAKTLTLRERAEVKAYNEQQRLKNKIKR